MNFFIKKATIETKKNIKDNLIVCVSDIHYKKDMTENFLNEISKHIDAINPNKICILGDFLDDFSIDSCIDMIEWIYSLSKKYPIYIALGNHDAKCQNEEKLYFIPHLLLFKLKNLHNVTLLEDLEYHKDENITFYGANFYNVSEKEEMISFYNNHVPEISKESFNILLSHSPYVMNEFNKLNKDYDNIDAIFSGHTHSGLMPFFLDKHLKTNHGLYTKDLGIFPSCSRGEIEIDKNKKGIIIPAITPLPSDNNILKAANKCFYKPGMELVRIKKG